MADPVEVRDAAALTRHIEARYHRRHREQLPRLVALSSKVEAVHAGDRAAPAGLAARLEALVGALERHMTKEELILFPAIRRGEGAALAGPIAAMRVDHDDHGVEVAEIRRLTSDLALPQDACRTWAALYDGLEDVLADLEDHLRLENDALFPRVGGSAA